MVAKNDVTGQTIQTKASTKAYADNYDRIFGKKKQEEKKDDQTNK